MQNHLIVLVGLIGSGKTTFAKHLSATRAYKYIDFDLEWHDNVQNKGGVIEQAVERIAGLCEEKSVVDGWWTWEAEWWLTENDQTMQLLQSLLGFPPTVAYLKMTKERALEQYLIKQKSGQYAETLDDPASCLDDPDYYAESIPYRMQYLARKVCEWAK